MAGVPVWQKGTSWQEIGRAPYCMIYQFGRNVHDWVDRELIYCLFLFTHLLLGRKEKLLGVES